jgi:threonine synthase
MRYVSTRGNYRDVSPAEAIVTGMVPRGGLFVPASVPELDVPRLYRLGYHELALRVLTPLLTGESALDYTEEELRDFIAAAYSSDRFDDPGVAPVRFTDDKTAWLELWHGPTAAFKDIALQIMPHFMQAGRKKLGIKNETVILVATSGDTGKAALEGYKDVRGTRIIVFYPKNGVSRVQELQMLTTAGENTAVVGVEGNFDDCQNMVKEIFGDASYIQNLSAAGFDLSSANSINWGRLCPQIVYYFWAYGRLVHEGKIQDGDRAVAVVPTGNFGNILAGWYAQQMGLPLSRLVCASNRNNVLTDFIRTGVYNSKREFFKTSSPSMDILISSNLERYLFEMNRHNGRKISEWYAELASRQTFRVDDTTRQRMKNGLWGGFTTEEATLAEIRRLWETHHYLVDTHTAVGSDVLRQYRAETGDETPAFICSTASPFKFNAAVWGAISGENNGSEELQMINKLADRTGVSVHHALVGLNFLPIRHDRVIPKNQGREAVIELLKM